MLTSDCVGFVTVVVTVAELFPGFGSPTVLDTLGVFVICVPDRFGVVFTFTTRGKLTVPPATMVCPAFSVHVNVPVPPAAIVLQVQLAGGVKETRVVFAGIVSLKVAFVSVIGPLFVTVCV